MKPAIFVSPRARKGVSRQKPPDAPSPFFFQGEIQNDLATWNSLCLQEVELNRDHSHVSVISGV